MPTWFIFTILSVITLAAADIAQRFSLRHKQDISAEANNFLVWIGQAILALIFLAFAGISFSISLNIDFIFKLAILGTVYFLAGTFYYTSLKSGSITISTILQSLSTVVSTVIGIVFLNEITSVLKFIGIGLILLAIFIANYTPRERLSKSNLYALVGALFLGIGYSLDKSFAISMNPHVYQVFFALSIALATLVYRGPKVVSDLRKFNSQIVPGVIVATVGFFIFNKLTFMAYTLGGEVGKIDAINNSVVFLILIFEVVILKQRSKLKRKIIAAIIAFAGVMILGYLI